MIKFKAGFAAFGEVNTPTELILEKQREAMGILEGMGFLLVAAPVITDDEKGMDVKKAVQALKKDDFDLLIVCITGWIPSHAVISVISHFKDKPMLLWGLAGKYINGKMVTTAAQAGTSALIKPMRDMGYIFKFIYESPGAPVKIKQIEAFARAAHAVHKLKDAKVGQMGYRDMRLYGTMFDGVSLKQKTGVEVEFFEMLEMVMLMEEIDIKEHEGLMKKISLDWKFIKEADPAILEKGIRIYLALKKIILERGYDAVSLIDVDGMKKLLGYPPSMVFMLLSNELGICTIPENDTLGAVTQLMCRYSTGQSAAYMEFYDFYEDRVLIGVPDYIPAGVTDGDIIVQPTGFGNLSQGLLNVSKPKTGRMTICRLGSSGSDYTMHIVTGDAVCARDWEEAGWEPPAPMLPSLEFIPDTGVDELASKVMSQHCIITYGDNRQVLEDICFLLGITVI